MRWWGGWGLLDSGVLRALKIPCGVTLRQAQGERGVEVTRSLKDQKFPVRPERVEGFAARRSGFDQISPNGIYSVFFVEQTESAWSQFDEPASPATGSSTHSPSSNC